MADSEHGRLMSSEGERKVGEGTKRSLHLRLLGAIAIQLHCPKFMYLTTALNRVLTDVDIAAYNRESARIDRMMREFGYADERANTAAFGNTRMIWENTSTGVHVRNLKKKVRSMFGTRSRR